MVKGLCPVCGQKMDKQYMTVDGAMRAMWDCRACFCCAAQEDLKRFWELDAETRALRRMEYIDSWKAQVDEGYIDACAELGVDGYDGEER